MIAGLVGAISAGASLAGTTINAMTSSGGYSVACGIETENWTKYPMMKPKVINDGGVIKNPPVQIMPGKKEAMMAHKTGGTATGTYGTVSWLVKDRRVVVMWSVGFNHDYYKNWLGVGITKRGYLNQDREWFDIMYNRGNTSTLSFMRKDFYDDANLVEFTDGELQIQGNMGTSHLPAVNVTVAPCNAKDYAPSVLKARNGQ